MFVAWRDLLFARGRFALITSVVILITLLIGMLSGLMNGLRGQNISAIADLGDNRIVFSRPAGGSALSYNDSVITQDQLAAWTSAANGAPMQPIGIAMGRVAYGDSQTTFTLFGVQPDFRDASGDVAPRQPGEVTLSKAAADKLHVTAGATVSIAGSNYRVASVRGDAWFSHTPVIWMNLSDWRTYSAATGAPNSAATVLAVHGIGDDAVATVNQAANTVTTSVSGSFNAIGGYKSENGSLMMMLGMLLAISGLVIGAFFTVWTIQRTSDIAILKALGASKWVLMRDALGQALMVLAAGVGVGIGLTAVLGKIAEGFAPFVVSLSTTVVPGLIVVGLGIAGAASALRIISKSSPLAAMGASR